MVGCLPEQVEGTQYRVTLLSGEQLDRLKAHMPQVMRYLQSELRNTHLAIDLTVAESTGARIFTPRDHLNAMRRANPEVDHLIDTFNLELA